MKPGKVTRLAVRRRTAQFIDPQWLGPKTPQASATKFTIEGFRAKDGTNNCNSRSIKMPDGRVLSSPGSADDGAPKGK